MPLTPEMEGVNGATGDISKVPIVYVGVDIGDIPQQRGRRQQVLDQAIPACNARRRHIDHITRLKLELIAQHQCCRVLGIELVYLGPFRRATDDEDPRRVGGPWIDPSGIADRFGMSPSLRRMFREISPRCVMSSKLMIYFSPPRLSMTWVRSPSSVTPPARAMASITVSGTSVIG